MAVPTATIAEVEKEVFFRLNGTDTADSVLSSRVRWKLSSALRTMGAAFPRYWARKEATFTLADGTKDYDLPDDFFSLCSPYMTYSDTTYYRIMHLSDAEYMKFEGNRVFQSEERPRFFTLVGSNATTGQGQIRFVATPDTAYTVNYDYYSVPVDERSDDGTGKPDPRIPVQFMQALVLETTLAFPQFLTAAEIQMYQLELRAVRADLNSAAYPVVGQAVRTDPFKVPFAGQGQSWIYPPETLSS